MGNEINKRDIEHLLQGNGEFLYLPEEVWDAAETGRLPLEEMILGLPVSQWMVMVMVLESAGNVENWEQIQAHLRAIRTQENIRYDYMDMHEANLLVCGKVKGDSVEAVESLLRFYADSNMRYARKVYTKQAFETAMDIMPQSIRSAEKVERALNLPPEQHEQKMACLREAVEIWPLLSEIIRSYAVLMGEEEKRKEQQARAAGEQLEQLAVEVKKQLVVLKENKMYAEAYSIVQQLKTMLPADKELEMIEEELKTHFS